MHQKFESCPTFFPLIATFFELYNSFKTIADLNEKRHNQNTEIAERPAQVTFLSWITTECFICRSFFVYIQLLKSLCLKLVIFFLTNKIHSVWTT